MEVSREWERVVRTTLGVTSDQPWSVQEWRRRVAFCLQRSCMMIVSAYELIRQNQPERATTLLVQCQKCLATVAMQDGDWRFVQRLILKVKRKVREKRMRRTRRMVEVV